MLVNYALKADEIKSKKISCDKNKDGSRSFIQDIVTHHIYFVNKPLTKTQGTHRLKENLIKL